MNYSLILLCAGSGKRTGLKYNKIFYNYKSYINILNELKCSIIDECNN